jgi:hypothetical protein
MSGLKELEKLSGELKDALARNQPEPVTQRPWDAIAVQRWQLNRLLNGLQEIQTTLDNAKLGDRMSVAAATGYASGMTSALMMLVDQMRTASE